MKVYLDNCILVDIEKGNLNLSEFTQIADAKYYFSSSHLNELRRGMRNNAAIKETRLNTITKICGTNYIVPDAPGFPMGEEMQTPNDVYGLCEYYNIYARSVEDSAAICNPDRDGILGELSLHKKEVGNIDPNQILNTLDVKLKESHLHCGLDDYLLLTKAATGNAKFSTLFNLMDSVCYWKDEKNINRLYDSSHANYAQYCDVLVTNDRRMSIKSRAIYAYYRINTIVMSSKEYLNRY